MDAENEVVTFDESNQYYLKAQDDFVSLKGKVEDIKEYLSDKNDGLSELSNVSPVGFEHNEAINWDNELSNIMDDWYSVMNNADNIRKIGELINNGHLAEFKKQFETPSGWIDFINKLAHGECDLSSVDSDILPVTINYSQVRRDGYTVQGYTVYGDMTLITGYSKEGEKSRIFVFDNKTGELCNTIILNNKSHVGGMSVDENGILFVTKSGGKIDTYNLNALQEKFKDNEIIDFSDENISKEYKIENDINTGESEATLYCYDGKVYTATYGRKGTLKEISYSYNTENPDQPRIESSVKVVSNNIASTVQGISIYKDQNGQEYLIAASSSEIIGSRIRIYEKNGDELKRVVSYNAKLDGLEGIKVDENGNIKGVCEYGDQSVNDLGNVDDYVNHVKKSHIDISPKDALFSLSGTWWDIQKEGPKVAAEVMETAKNTLTGAAEAASDVVVTVTETAGKVATGAVEAATGVVEAASDAVETAAKTAGKVAGEAGSTIKEVLPSILFNRHF